MAPRGEDGQEGSRGENGGQRDPAGLAQGQHNTGHQQWPGGPAEGAAHAEGREVGGAIGCRADRERERPRGADLDDLTDGQDDDGNGEDSDRDPAGPRRGGGKAQARHREAHRGGGIAAQCPVRRGRQHAGRVLQQDGAPGRDRVEDPDQAHRGVGPGDQPQRERDVQHRLPQAQHRVVTGQGEKAAITQRLPAVRCGADVCSLADRQGAQQSRGQDESHRVRDEQHLERAVHSRAEYQSRDQAAGADPYVDHRTVHGQDPGPPLSRRELADQRLDQRRRGLLGDGDQEAHRQEAPPAMHREVSGGGRALEHLHHNQHAARPVPVGQPPHRQDRGHRGQRRDRQPRADRHGGQPHDTDEEQDRHREEQARPHPVHQGGSQQPRQEPAGSRPDSHRPSTPRSFPMPATRQNTTPEGT
jgi:hypothetical protein